MKIFCSKIKSLELVHDQKLVSLFTASPLLPSALCVCEKQTHYLSDCDHVCESAIKEYSILLFFSVVQSISLVIIHLQYEAVSSTLAECE